MLRSVRVTNPNDVELSVLIGMLHITTPSADAPLASTRFAVTAPIAAHGYRDVPTLVWPMQIAPTNQLRCNLAVNGATSCSGAGCVTKESSMIHRLLPRQIDNTYGGHKVALWLLGMVVLVKGGIGMGTIFNGRSAAITADGIPLATFMAAGDLAPNSWPWQAPSQHECAR